MPILHTFGFRTPLDLADHFQDHGLRLGIATEGDYETFADSFLCPICPPTGRQFTRRRNGDIVRYDQTADVFGVKAGDGFIKTCYIPDPARHGFPTNLDYYLSEEANNK
jgi:pyocin large subunit-like protein